jgi:hypothetical protein
MKAPQLEGRIETGQLPQRTESFGGLRESGLGSTNPSNKIVSPALTRKGCTASTRARDGLGPSSGQGPATNEASPLGGRSGGDVIGRGEGARESPKRRM